jgi:predicted AlkP superfamily pyrophosphatase or phosphodiesterase
MLLLAIVSTCYCSGGYGSAKRVVFIGLDGLGAEYVAAMQSGIFRDLMLVGSSTVSARANYPTMSMPNWAALITGSGPEETGVWSNEWSDRYVTNPLACGNYGIMDTNCLQCSICKSVAPTLQNRVRGGATKNDLITWASTICATILQDAAKAQCNNYVALAQSGAFDGLLQSVIKFLNADTSDPLDACYVPYFSACENELPAIGGKKLPTSLMKAVKDYKRELTTSVHTDWDGIAPLFEASVVDKFVLNPNPVQLGDSFISYLKTAKPSVAFTHWDDLDEAGHNSTWGSPQYMEALSVVSARLQKVIDALTLTGVKEETLVVISADHGGGNGHGHMIDKELKIPVIFIGPKVQNVQLDTFYIKNVDIPATILYALGIPQPPEWIGKPVVQIYGEQKVVASSGATTVSNAIVIGIASLMGKAITIPGNAFEQIVKDGDSTANARSVMPSTSMPNWASILYGAGPEEHGIVYDNWNPANQLVSRACGTGYFPSMFEVAKSQKSDIVTGAFYAKNLSALLNPQTLDAYTYNPQDSVVVDTAIRHLEKNAQKSNLIFIQLEELATEVKTTNYGTPSYYSAVRQADLQVLRVLDKIKSLNLHDKTLVIITSDKGGVPSTANEGSMFPHCMEVPFLMYGPMVKKGALTSHIRNLDVAATALTALGMAKFPKCWISKAHELVIAPPRVNNSKNTGMIVGIIFTVLFVLASVAIVGVLYYKRKACFAGRRELQFTRLRFTRDTESDLDLTTLE